MAFLYYKINDIIKPKCLVHTISIRRALKKLKKDNKFKKLAVKSSHKSHIKVSKNSDGLIKKRQFALRLPKKNRTVVVDMNQ